MSARDARADVAADLSRIYEVVSAHFAHEEEYMRETRYMAYAEHKEDHEILLDDLRDIIEQARSDAYAEARLSADLEYWFSEHFRTHDARLHCHAHKGARARGRGA
jgi:hemerythrin